MCHILTMHCGHSPFRDLYALQQMSRCSVANFAQASRSLIVKYRVITYMKYHVYSLPVTW